MEFHENVLSLIYRPPTKISLIGARLPTSRDTYYISKRHEIIEQYMAARMFLNKTTSTDWSYWFNTMADKHDQQFAELTMRAYLYETSLMYYNIVVDLSWAICYLTSEFSLSHSGNRIDFGKLTSVDEAYSLMRKAERLVSSPTSEDNPFGYLKLMCPEFSSAIDTIVSFWERFMSTNIRQQYNYCKHKGKPLYSEIQAMSGKNISIHIQPENGLPFEIASDPHDVRLQCSLEDSIAELLSFDNDELFPYISKLFKELEKILNLSQCIM